MRHPLFLLLLTCPVLAGSGSLSVSSYDSFNGDPHGDAPRFVVNVPANQVRVGLRLQATEADEIKALAAVDSLADAVRRELAGPVRVEAGDAEKKDAPPPPRIESSGPVSLSPALGARAKGSVSSIFGGNGGSDRATGATGNFVIIAPLAAGQNPQALAVELKARVVALKLADSLQADTTTWTFGLADPEQHRAALVKQVSNALDKDLRQLGEKTRITVTGLDKALSVQAASDRFVRVSLPVSFSYEIQR